MQETVYLNGEFMPLSTPLRNGDRVEIVNFVGGG